MFKRYREKRKQRAKESRIRQLIETVLHDYWWRIKDEPGYKGITNSAGSIKSFTLEENGISFGIVRHSDGVQHVMISSELRENKEPKLLWSGNAYCADVAEYHPGAWEKVLEVLANQVQTFVYKKFRDEEIEAFAKKVNSRSPADEWTNNLANILLQKLTKEKAQ